MLRRHLVSSACAAVVAVATLGACGDPADPRAGCTDFTIPSGFWQQDETPSRETLEQQVELTITCGILDGLTPAEVTRKLGPPLPMSNFGSTDEESFRIWAYPVGLGLNVKFSGPGETVNSVSAQKMEDDFWR